MTSDPDIHDEPLPQNLSTPPSLDDYWQITLVGSDWSRVLGIWMAGQSKPNEFQPGDVYMGSIEFLPVFWLKRTRFASADLAKLVGQPVEAVDKAKRLMLKPLKGMNQDALATVPYFGIA